MKKTLTLTVSPKSTKTESFKRPDHPDFWDASECRKKQFSGVRKNDMALRWEFWILGEMVKDVPFLQVQIDEFALTKAHMEIFYMAPDPDLFKRPTSKNEKGKKK